MKDSFYYFNWFWGLGVIEIFLLRNIYLVWIYNNSGIKNSSVI